jgi:puromycin-sensitive aminopeptidase
MTSKGFDRLPRTAIPLHYILHIAPDLKAGIFSGEADIHLDITEPVQEIVLNSAELIITEAIICNKNGTSLIGKVVLDEPNERACIKFDGIIGKNSNWHLQLKFNGILNGKLRGFYRSTYKTSDGKEDIIATTKFEPADARRAFPCFDEPDFKAEFQINLTIDEDLDAISNSHLLKTIRHSETGKKTLKFASSIKMSTYLVAFIIGHLEKSKSVLSGDTQIRVYCVPGKADLAQYALAVAQFSLEYFEEYFRKSYPGKAGFTEYGFCKKLDLVAIPDFASGAMENFACITFRETALLIDENNASLPELMRVAEVVMHEIAHMWFGDLVTMSWWNGLWLNEAFATFMAAKAMDAWKPEWKFWDAFNVERAYAMRIDGLHNTRAIEFPVGSPEQARAMFDVLTYDKGCAILRMLELTLGEEKFREGIVRFLYRYQFANADTPDLWDAIEHVNAGALACSVNEMMNSWVFQPGYPLITVEKSPIDGCVTFRQTPFKYLPTGAFAQTQTSQVWQIPIVIRTQLNLGDGNVGTVEKTILLSSCEQTIYLGEDLSSLVVNANGSGFFRVQYLGALQDNAINNLRQFNPAELFNFVSDNWALVLSGQIRLESFLQMAKLLTTNDVNLDLNIWTLITGALRYLHRAQIYNQESFISLTKQIIGPTLDSLGWESRRDEDPQTSQIRALLLTMLGALGDELVVSNARDLYALYQLSKTSVDANLIPAVIEILAINGNAALYDHFDTKRKQAAITGTPQEERRYLFALASFGQAELIEKTLVACLDGSIRTQDAPLILQRLLQNQKASLRAWEFVQANWEQIIKSYAMQMIVRLCEGITALVDRNLLPGIKRFFAEHPVKSGEKAIPQYLEQLEIACQFQIRELECTEKDNG